MICKLRNPITLAILYTFTDVLTTNTNLMLNRVGDISFTLPATSPNVALLAENLVADMSADNGMQLGVFIITNIMKTSAAQSKVVTVSGPTLDKELEHEDVGDNTISTGASSNSTDITDIMTYHPEWTVEFEGTHLGTEKGTNLVGAGESVLEMLRQAQAQSGEFFTLSRLTALREIYWFRNSEQNSQTFLLQPDMVNTEADPFTTPITKLSISTRSADVVTDINVYGAGLGEDQVTTTAFPASLRTAYRALWPDYTISYDTGHILNHTLELTHPHVYRRIKFGSVRPASDSTADQEAAAISLFNAAMAWMEDHKQSTIQYVVDILPKRFTTLLPGSTFYVDYDDGVTTFAKNLVLLESHTTVGADGIARTSCVMAERITAVMDDSTFVASKFSATDETLRHATAPSTGSPTSTPYQHHSLLGLEDDDHSIYLPANGSRPITGNVEANPGVTIDGVDISAHASDADAHHAWPLADSDIPATIARDSEVVAHTNTPNAHHNWPLLDGDIPATIARDSEVTTSIATHSDDENAHHSQIHNIVGSDHTATGDEWDIVGLTNTNTLGLITPSDQPGSSEAILKTNSSGELHLERFQANAITSHLIPETTDTFDLGSSLLLWRKAWISEIQGTLFVENTISAIGGWFVIPHGQGTIPASIGPSDSSIDFGQAMTPNDFVILRNETQVEYLQITSLSSGTTYNVTRDMDGSGANSWVAGQVFLVLGYSGDGSIWFDAQTSGPRMSVFSQGSSYNAQTEQVRIGDLSSSWGYSATPTFGIALGEYAADKGNLTWDETNGLRLRTYTTNVITLDNSGNAEISGFLELGSNGGIFQGTGTPTTPTTGLKIWNDSGIGRMATYESGTLQVGFNTTGQLIAGGGEVILDETGISLQTSEFYQETNSLKFLNGTSLRARIYGLESSTALYNMFNTEAITGKSSTLQFNANAPSGQDASIYMATNNGAFGSILLRSTGGSTVITLTAATITLNASSSIELNADVSYSDNLVAARSSGNYAGLIYVPLTYAAQNSTWSTAAGNKTSTNDTNVTVSSTWSSVPPEAKAIYVRLASASATLNHRVRLGNLTIGDQLIARSNESNSAIYIENNGTVNLSNGVMTIRFSGTVTMGIWVLGYFI